MTFNIIVAYDQKRGIGKDNQLAWHLPEDLKYFSNMTKGQQTDKQNVVIMGRKTWESIPEKHRPLSGRINVVLTRQTGYNLPEGVQQFADLDEALAALENQPINEIFVIGGANLYEQAIQHPQCQKILVTEIKGDYHCDTFFPEIPDEFKLVDEGEDLMSVSNVGYKFVTYSKL
jgi:dihydrofolate reductase